MRIMKRASHLVAVRTEGIVIGEVKLNIQH